MHVRGNERLRAPRAGGDRARGVRGSGFDRRLAIVVLLIAAAAVYVRAPSFDFVNYDDPAYVTGNPHVTAGLTLDGVRWAFATTTESNWHPLTWLSLMLDDSLGGTAPWIFHLTNVLLHAAGAVLLFLGLDRMTGRPWRSLLVAALFAVHPLHVESVAWVSERKDVLSGVFFMLVLLAWARYAERPAAGRYAAVAALLALGLMAKPMLVSLPFILLLLDVWPLGRWDRGESLAALAIEKIPLLALCAASAIVTLIAQRRGGAIASMESFPVGARLAGALVAPVVYIGQMLWPANLAVFYPSAAAGSTRSGGWSSIAVLACAAILVAATTMALVAFRRRPYLLVGWGWYLVSLVPVLGLVQVGLQAHADRYTYLPLIGIFVTLAWGVPDALGTILRRSDRDLSRFDRSRERSSQDGQLARGSRTGRLAIEHAPIAVLLPAVIVLVLAAVAHAQTLNWRSSTALFSHAVAVTGPNGIAENSLGMALHAEGRSDEAIERFERAVRILPDYADARLNLGSALIASGRTEDAIAQFREAVRLSPASESARLALAAGLERAGRPADAIAQYREAAGKEAAAAAGAAQTPEGSHPPALAFPNDQNRGGPVSGGGTDVPSGAAGRESSDLRDPTGEARARLGRLLLRGGRREEAIVEMRAAARLRPADADLLRELGTALLEDGQFEEAAETLARASRLRPRDAPVRSNLGLALARAGRLEEARTELVEATWLAPEDVGARVNLGLVLLGLGRPSEAAAQFQAAVRLAPSDSAARELLDRARRETSGPRR